MNSSIEFRPFTVSAVNPAPNPDGSRTITFDSAGETWAADLFDGAAPNVGDVVRVFFQDESLDWTFEGFRNAHKV